MSYNTFGHLFRVTTFGESHGVAIGCVVDGCPPRIALTEADIQPYLDKRRPDRKSTRLNSSHVAISYAVFCLKKKTICGRAKPIMRSHLCLCSACSHPSH